METFRLTNKERYNSAMSYLSECLNESKFNLCITIKKISKSRSLEQNKLLWLYLTCIERENGTSRDDLHEYFKSVFIEPKNVFDKNITGSTKELNTKEFTDYINKIVMFASSELGIILPDPKDLEFERFKEYYSNYL